MNTRLISCQRKRKKKWSYKYAFNPVAHHRLRDLHTVFYEFGCNYLCSEILREALALAKSKKLLSHAPWRPEAGIIDLAIGRPGPVAFGALAPPTDVSSLKGPSKAFGIVKQPPRALSGKILRLGGSCRWRSVSLDLQ